jgi:tRNA(fMet)-specific endonuclease VapC
VGVVIDTSWLIRLERLLAARSARTSGLPAEPVVSAVSIAELRVGVELASASHREQRAQFVELVAANATVLPFGLSEAFRYAELAAALRRAGTPIGDRDLMIASTAVANGHSVLTLNAAEFERVPGLVLLPDPLAPAP